MGLLERVNAAARGRTETRYSVDQWLNQYLIPSQMQYGGNQYSFGLNQTMAGERVQRVAATLPGYAAALRACPPAFAAQMVRALVLSQARFVFRNRPSSRTPRRLFGTTELGILERPWPNGTTGDLISYMEWHAGLAGTAFVYRQPDRLRVLRPDYTAVVYGSELEPEDPATALDAKLLGFVYQNGGIGSGRGKPQTLLAQDVAMWAPIPDPERPGLGQSWVTAALQDIQGDRAATLHKLKFFENGATPNMVVKGITAATREQFEEIVAAMEDSHAGVANAYKTLYLVAGADATVVGADLKQLDFKATQGAGETRIAMLGRVPAPILQISEGLAGSSLNAGNFGMSRRIFADTWVYPTLQDLCAAVAPIIRVPSDAELWTDTGDMPLLREDAKDAAEITQVQAATVAALVAAGYTSDSAKAAVIANDMSLLVHTGLVSVQLQVPGSNPNAALTGGSQ